MFESSNTSFLLGALSLGFASFVYVFYGPKQSPKCGKSGKSKKASVNGLYNFGNQCFINSVLQSLASCKSMHSWLNYANVLHNQTNNSLTYQVLNTLNILNNTKVCSESSFSPIDVLNGLRAHHWNISNEEQDAFELFNVLTSTLESELYSSLPHYSLRDALLIEELMSQEVSPERSPTISTRGSNLNSLVDNRIPKSLPTRGMLASQLYCRRCGYKYPLHLDTFDTISLVMPNNIIGVPLQLQDCLNKFVMNEIIHEVVCETCSKMAQKHNYKSAFVKKLNFAKMPQLLCLHIQRLVWLNNGHPLKRCEYITFPEYLDMDSYVYKSVKCNTQSATSAISSIGLIGGASTPVKQLSRPTQLSLNAQLTSDLGLDAEQQPFIAKYRYRLCSVIVHLGDASSGHFICYRRGTQLYNELNWYYISDTNVLEVSLTEVLNSSAYMLFYERIKNNH